MDGLLAIYAITITFELVMSLVMALILMMILAPAAGQSGESRREQAAADRQLSPALDVALRDVFRSISHGSDDLSQIVHTQRLLEQYQRQSAAKESIHD